jgi:enterochelin esterase-like enzyme
MKRITIILGLFLITQLGWSQFTGWDDFVSEHNAATTQAARDSIIQEFLSYAGSTSGFPYIEDGVAYFIYYGSASLLQVAGDFNGWSPGNGQLNQLSPSGFFYRAYNFEDDARLDYKFVRNGSTWMLDPRNPNTAPGGFGSNSELAMPDYVQPPEIEYYPDYNHGSLSSAQTISSEIIGQAFTYYVYTPPGYDTDTERTYPVLYMLDGQEYDNYARIDNIADYCINNNLTDAFILVLQRPNNRNSEYVLNSDFVDFLADELVTKIDTTYRTMTSGEHRGIAGVSYGGLCATYSSFLRPDVFGLCAAQSPAYWPNEYELLTTIENEGFNAAVKMYIDWGTYEGELATYAAEARDWLLDNGNDVVWAEYHEGHSWGHWRAHIDDALKFFFPPVQTSIEPATKDKQFLLISKVYPNPFNPRATIEFEMVESARVTFKIFDPSGKVISQLSAGVLGQGQHRFYFDGSQYANGIYLYQIEAGKYSGYGKMILLK